MNDLVSAYTDNVILAGGSNLFFRRVQMDYKHPAVVFSVAVFDMILLLCMCFILKAVSCEKKMSDSDIVRERVPHVSCLGVRVFRRTTHHDNCFAGTYYSATPAAASHGGQTFHRESRESAPIGRIR